VGAGGQLPDRAPGLGGPWAQLRPDVESFEAIKGRLLNASHMPLAYPAALTGYRWVSEAANDPAIAQLLNTFMVVDAGALLDAPADVSLADYQAVVVGRFAKPPRARYRAAGRARRRRQAPSAPHATAEGPLAIGGDCVARRFCWPPSAAAPPVSTTTVNRSRSWSRTWPIGSGPCCTRTTPSTFKAYLEIVISCRPRVCTPPSAKRWPSARNHAGTAWPGARNLGDGLETADRRGL
jgi:hypothetical protein